jgi:hypothetical protein
VGWCGYGLPAPERRHGARRALPLDAWSGSERRAARLLLMCLLLRSSWLTVEGDRQVGAAGVLIARADGQPWPCRFGVAGGVPKRPCDRDGADCPSAPMQASQIRPLLARYRVVGPALLERHEVVAKDEYQHSRRDWQVAVSVRGCRSRHESEAGPRATCRALRRSADKQQAGVSAAGRSNHQRSSSAQASCSRAKAPVRAQQQRAYRRGSDPTRRVLWHLEEDRQL